MNLKVVVGGGGLAGGDPFGRRLAADDLDRKSVV